MALKTRWKGRRKGKGEKGRKEGGREIQVFTINIFTLKTEKQFKKSHLKLHTKQIHRNKLNQGGERLHTKKYKIL